MEILLVIIGAILMIGFIIWWFFGPHKTEAVTAQEANGSQEVEVIVNGGYTPNTVVLKQGIPAKLTFTRNDPSSCFSHVVFPDFGINEELPVGEPHQISIDTSAAGEFAYSCGMNMFHGKVVVKQ